MSPLTAYAIYGAAGIQLAASVVGGMLLGHYADEKLGSGPWIAITGLALGFIGGLVNLVRITTRYEKARSRKDGEDGDNPGK